MIRREVVRSLVLTVMVLDAASCVPKERPHERDASLDANHTEERRADSQGSFAKPRPDAPDRTAAPDDILKHPFVDDFERSSIGPAYLSRSDAWRIDDGKLCGKNARNQGIWLRKRLPPNVRIEFDAESASPDGDIKVEIFGDGASGASGVSYNDATGYIAILGGWKNSLHVLARLREHGSDRLETRLEPEADSPAKNPVVPGRVYALSLERTNEETLSFRVDGILIHRLEDPEPLMGPGHDHFAFNDWQAPVCFDNLKVTPLASGRATESLPQRDVGK